METYKGHLMTERKHYIEAIEEYDLELARLVDEYIREVDLEEEYSALYDDCFGLDEEVHDLERELEEKQEFINVAICFIWDIAHLRPDLMPERIKKLQEYVEDYIPNVGDILRDKNNWKEI